MEVLYGQYYLGDIEEWNVIGEKVLATQQPKNFSTLDKLEAEIDMSVVFETLF